MVNRPVNYASNKAGIYGRLSNMATAYVMANKSDYYGIDKEETLLGKFANGIRNIFKRK